MADSTKKRTHQIRSSSLIFTLAVGAWFGTSTLPFTSTTNCFLDNSRAVAAPRKPLKRKQPTAPIFPSSRNVPRKQRFDPQDENQTSATTQKTPDKKHGVRGVFGLVSGLGHVSGAVFAFGGDYAYRFRPEIDFTAGFLHWNNTYSDPSYSLDHSVTSFDGGADYIIRITETFAVRGSSRLGFALSSASIKELTIGIPENKNSTISVLMATVGGGGSYKMGELEIGGELRKPVFFSDLQDSGTHVYLLGTAGMAF